MKIIKPSYEIIKLDYNDIRIIEEAARTCYKSENNIKDGSAEKMIQRLIDSEHEAMLEHAGMTVRFIVDRGISHELVRHRICSFAQESTRYCNYSLGKFNSEITVIMPFYLEPGTDGYNEWYESCLHAEKAYFKLLDIGYTAQEARCVLPTSLKTEVVVTTNFREWRHILNLRAVGKTGAPHPQMVEVMMPLLKEMKEKAPVLFSDIR